MMRAMLTVAAAMAVSAGCATLAPSRFANPMILTAAEPVAVEKIARRVLAEFRFTIETPPAAPGRLTTEPVTGASWFEFWRPDTVGNIQRLESSLHTTRRRATVVVSPKGGGTEVLVKVVKERRSAPGQGPQHISQAFNLYDPGDTELSRQNELAPADFDWVDMGRDDRLEQRILERIQLAVGRGRAG